MVHCTVHNVELALYIAYSVHCHCGVFLINGTILFNGAHASYFVGFLFILLRKFSYSCMKLSLCTRCSIGDTSGIGRVPQDTRGSRLYFEPNNGLGWLRLVMGQRDAWPPNKLPLWLGFHQIPLTN